MSVLSYATPLWIAFGVRWQAQRDTAFDSKPLSFATMRRLFTQKIQGGVVLTLATALQIALLATFIAGQPAKQPTARLLPGRTLDRQLAKSETHTYNVTLKQGELLRVTVDHSDIDLTVTLFSPNDKSIVEMDSYSGRLWRKDVSALAETNGSYRIEVKPSEYETRAGTYRIRLEKPRVANAADKDRIDAQGRLISGLNWFYRDSYRLALHSFEKALELWQKLGDKEWEAITLTNIGWVNGSLSNIQEAIDAHTRAVELHKSNADLYGECESINGLGLINSALSKYTRANEYYRQALDICRKLKDKRCEATKLNNVGTAFNAQGYLQESLNYFNQALPLYRALGDRSGEALSLSNIGATYSGLGDRKKALEYYNQVLPARRELGDTLGEALTLNNMGAAYLGLGEFKQALNHYNQALPLFRTLADRANQAVALTNIGVVLDKLGERKESLKYHEESLQLRRAVKDRRGEGITLNNIGYVYRNLGETQKALEYFTLSLPILREVNDRHSESTTLNNLASLLHKAGDSRKAIQYYNEALVVIRAIGDRSGEGMALGNLGLVYYGLGEQGKALEYYEQALRLARETGDQSGEALTLNNIGAVYNFLGERAKALEYYELAIPIQRRIGDRNAEALTLNNIGLVHFELGQLGQAIKHYYQALPLLRAVGDRATEASTLNNIGGAYDELGDQQKALEFYNQSLLLSRASGNRSTEAQTLSNIGVAYLALGERSKALDSFTEAALLFEAMGERAGEANTLLNLMISMKGENPRLAILYGKRSVSLYQSVRRDIQGLAQELQKSYLKQVERPYRLLSELLIKEGRIAEAEAVLEMLKEEEYFQFVRRDDGVASALLKRVGLNEIEAQAIKRFDAHADRITSLANEKAVLEAEREQWLRDRPDETFPKQTRYAELESLLADARRVFNLFLTQLKSEFGKRDERVVAVESSLQKDLRNWGDKNTAVVSTIVGDEQLNLIVTTANTQRAHTINIRSEQLNELVAEFRSVLMNPHNDPRPSGQRLYNLLVKPIEVDLQGAGVKLVVWSLDGSLRYVPVAALYDQNQGYLAERYASAVITLASRTNLGALAGDKKTWQALGAGVSQASSGFSALPAVPDELRGIVRDRAAGETERGVITGRRLLDDQFTEASFKDSLGLRFPLVHIASHFRFSPGEDKDSFLLLGKGEQLTLDEVRLADTLFRGVELLTLSACNTATGNLKGDGSEIEGFGVIAQEQGAKAIMATLWPVADSSTRDFMVDFYGRFNTQSQMSKAEAIRQAQLSLLRGKSKGGGTRNTTRSDILEEGDARVEFKVNQEVPYAHPYFWAPFILIGNWR
jgi:CHAT domain-containing protein/Tfp pilus assembly protein PilF